MMAASFRRLLTSRREYNGSGGNAITDTTNLAAQYSKYAKNGDIELSANEHEAHAKEDVVAHRALFFSFRGAVIRHARMHRRSDPGLQRDRPTISATCGAEFVAKYPILRRRPPR